MMRLRMPEFDTYTGPKLSPLVAQTWLEQGVPTYAHICSEFKPGNYEHQAMARIDFCTNISFAIPCKEALDAITEGMSEGLIELGAGTGYWSALLRNIGRDIIASDDYSGEYKQEIGKFSPIQKLSGQDMVDLYPGRNVFMCWPNYDHEWAYEAMLRIRKGRRIYLISEGHGGCVASDEAFDFLDNKCKHLKSVKIPQWAGMHDRLDIYERT